MSNARRIAGISILLIGVLGAIGCAHQMPASVPAPLAPEVRSQLGTIGVVWADAAEPSLSYMQPVKGGLTGAGLGASKAMEGWFRGLCCAGGHPFGIVGVVLVGVTVVPLLGASVGAIAAPSAAAVEEAEAALKQAQEDIWTAEWLQGHVLDAAQTRTPYTFVGLSRPIPTAPAQDGEPLPETPSRPVPGTGVTTVLELHRASLWLGTEEAGTHINPDLSFTVRLGCQLRRIADNEVLYAYEATYRSPEARTLVAWGADGARVFRAELETATRETVAKLLDRLFLAEAPATQPAETGNDAEK